MYWPSQGPNIPGIGSSRALPCWWQNIQVENTARYKINLKWPFRAIIGQAYGLPRWRYAANDRQALSALGISAFRNALTGGSRHDDTFDTNIFRRLDD